MRLVHSVWSIVAWSVAFALMIGLVVVCLPLMLIVPLERWQGGLPARVMGFIPRLTLSRMSATYDAGFDRSRTSVYVCNHTSMLDGHVAIYALPHPFCGIENAAHFLIPGYGWLMKMGNAIPVYKSAKNRTQRLVDAAKERASRGISILAFPEAHRTKDGAVHPFRTGAFFMAREAGLPIVPVAVRGMYHVLPKGNLRVTPGNLEVYVGPQLETAGLSDDAIRAMAEDTRQLIVDWIDRKATATSRTAQATRELSPT